MARSVLNLWIVGLAFAFSAGGELATGSAGEAPSGTATNISPLHACGSSRLPVAPPTVSSVDKQTPPAVLSLKSDLGSSDAHFYVGPHPRNLHLGAILSWHGGVAACHSLQSVSVRLQI